MTIRRVATLKTADDLVDYLAGIDVELPFDEEVRTGPDAPLAQPIRLRNGFTIGNRWCVLPMEGWDGTTDGQPTELTMRRWRRFGLSGAKLIWGGEAVAVRPDGRANPNQLVIDERTLPGLTALREALIDSHRASFERTDDLLVGLQLTHSGRFARPEEGKGMQPRVLYQHPILDARVGLAPDTQRAAQALLTDEEIAGLVDDFVRAAGLARRAGFDFVDIKHCHGYLGHEFLSAVERPGRYGGSFENRTRFLREIVAGIRAEVPGLEIGVRFSAVDTIPFQPGVSGFGEPVPWDRGTYPYAFGGDGSGLGVDLVEPCAFVDLLASLDVELVCVTAGSAYYNPHVIRPALFPPSDGYGPPEDPLAGVARHVAVTAALKKHRPELVFVGSGYSYLQEWLPSVAQHTVRTGMTDLAGMGRMTLSYPDLIADVLAGRPLQRKRICRTLSDCTTAPRAGLVSGCYALDEFYGARPEAATLKEVKAR